MFRIPQANPSTAEWKQNERLETVPIIQMEGLFFLRVSQVRKKKKKKEKLDPFPTFLYLQMIYNFFSWGKGAGTKQNKTKQNKKKINWSSHLSNLSIHSKCHCWKWQLRHTACQDFRTPRGVAKRYVSAKCLHKMNACFFVGSANVLKCFTHCV